MVFGKGITGIQGFVVALHETAAMEHVSARLGEISMRPKPMRSYSAEKGLWLMRISRMVDFGEANPRKSVDIELAAVRPS